MGDERAEHEQGARQVRRLERITDVVYALVLWRLFVLIPKPGDAGWHWDTIGAFLKDEVLTFVLIAIGLVFTIIYWTQHNALFSKLARTDGRHTALSILQLFLLLLFLYSLRLGIELESSAATRAFESVTAALVGYSAAWGWSYAVKQRRLLRDDVTNDETHGIADRILAEPIAASLTALVSPFPILWELTWLTYPVIAAILSRRRMARASR
jgi:uncharacterized membrane protein